MAISVNMGERIKARIKELGLNQTTFGEKFGVQRGTVSRWIKQSKVPDRYWPQIYQELGMSEQELRHGRQGDTVLQNNVPRETLGASQNAAQPPQPGRIGRELGPGYVRGLRDGLQRAQEAIRILQLGLTETEQAGEEELVPARSAAHLRAVVEEAAGGTQDAQVQSGPSRAGASHK